jgi:tetratricopeptide (TPR) repeat protein
LLASAEGAARRALAQVHRIEGDDGPSWLFGEAILRIGRARQATPPPAALLDEARDRLLRVAILRPDWSRVPLALAEIDRLRGDAAAAIRNYLRAIDELGDRSPATLTTAAQLLYARGQHDQAKRMIALLREQDAPISGGLQRMAAEIAFQAQDYGRALEQAELAVSAKSDDYRELIWLGRLRWAAGQPAEPLFRRAVTEAPEAPEARVALVSYLVGSGQAEAAEAATREAEAQLPRDQAALALARCHELIGQGERAKALYQEALAARPDDVPTLKEVATFHLRSGHMGDAAPHLQHIVDVGGLTEDAAAARRTLALVTAAAGGYQQSLKALEILGVDDTNRPAAKVPTPDLRTQAKVLAMRPDRASRRRAIALLEQVVTREPGATSDRFLLAQLREAGGDWDQARADLLRLLDAHPKNTGYLAHYVNALLRHGRNDEARVYLGKLKDLAPDQPGTIAIEARVLAARGQGKEAVALLENFAREDDARAGSVARLLEELGQAAAAERLYRRFVAVNQSQRPEIVLTLAGFLGRQGRTQEALSLLDDRAWASLPAATLSNASVIILYGAGVGTNADALREQVAHRLEAAIDAHPETVSIRFDLANLRSLQGRYDEAAAIFRAIHERDKTRAAPLNNLAWMLALQGKADEADSLIRQAIALEGATPDLLDTRAIAHLAMGQADTAIDDLENAIAISPTGDKYFHLAQAYRTSGKRTEADQAFRKAKELGLTGNGLHPLERGAFDRLSTEFTR